MTASLIAGNFVTGKILQRAIPARTGSVEALLNAAGTIGMSVRLPAVDPSSGTVLPLVSDIVEGRSFLGYVQDGVLLNAGPVWSSTFDADSQVWTLAAAGARSYLDYRFILPALDDSNLASLPAGQSVTVGNQTVALRTIAKQLLQNAIAANGGSFPVDFEPDFAGTATRTYDGLAMKRLNEALSDLSAVDGGPDIMLDPYITADGNFVRWRLVTGNPEITQPGADWVFDTTVPVPTATGVSVSRTAATLATTAYEIGAQNQDTSSDGTTTTATTLMAKRHLGGLIARGFPRLETSVQHTDVVIPATLQAYADADAAAGQYYTDTWTLKTRISMEPKLASLNPGDYAEVKVRNHPILGNQTTRVRILSIAANLNEQTASIACAPQRTGV